MKLNLSAIPNNSPVMITNLPWGDDEDGKLFIRVSGTLEKSEDKTESHFVRVKEDYEGTSGVHFYDKNITEIEKLPSGRIVIVLKM